MKVNVEFMGQLGTAIGRPADELELPLNTTVFDLIVSVSDGREIDLRAHLIDPNHQVQPSLLIAVNGIACLAHQAASTVLQDGDSVILMPPISGG